MTTYTHEFYATRDKATRYSAETMLGLVLKRIGPVRSAVDVGCGVGTWLSVLRDRNVEDIQGYDGPWVERELLEIPPECFEQVELSHALPIITRRYDLAISLEVAEHLPAEKAAAIVKMLTVLSDSVLFSAAIPGQGGTGHINEQWPKYWIKLFEAHGYGVDDSIRPQTWNDSKIPVWYRQNTLVFIKADESMPVLDLVHPELYMAHAQPGVKGTVRQLCTALDTYFKKRSTG